jgi:hypothetical protein
VNNKEQNAWARRRAQVELVERYARIAGILLDSGVTERSLPVAARQAREAELDALNQRIEIVVQDVRKIIAGIL